MSSEFNVMYYACSKISVNLCNLQEIFPKLVGDYVIVLLLQTNVVNI